MPADQLHQDIERVLAGYSRVEPRPEALRRWMQPPAAAPRRHLPMAIWAAVVAAMLILLTLAWYRSRTPHLAEPTLAGHHTELVPVKPLMSGAANTDQQKLLKMLQSNPAGLANQPASTLVKKPR